MTVTLSMPRDLFDPAPARAFLEALGKDPSQTYFRSIAPGKGANRSRKGADLRGFDPMALGRDNTDGSSIYCVIGTGGTASGSKGAVKDDDITSCPALFGEWDDRPIEWQVNAWQELRLPEPTVMVFSGGKSVQPYWRLLEPISPAQWKEVTQRLIAYCGFDPQCSNPSRVMRLPGFAYIDKKSGKPTGEAAAILHQSDRAYSLEEVLACLPEPVQPELPQQPVQLPVRPSGGNGLGQTLTPRALEEIRAAADFIPMRVEGGNTYETSRRALCGCAAALAEIGLPEAMAIDLLAAKWPDRRSAEQVLESSTTREAKTFWAIASEHGYDLSRSSKPAANNLVDLARRNQQRQALQGSDAPAAAPGPAPYRVLGWCQDRSRIYYQHRQTGQIAHLKPSATASPFLHLAELSYWETLFPSKAGINWAAACSHVIEEANRAGTFSLEHVRGRGVWMDGGRAVWHLGDRLEVDGQKVPLIEHRSAHHYLCLPGLEVDRIVAPLSNEQGDEIRWAVAAMGWSSKLDHLHLLGWAVLANVGGALEKRPILQITSRFGTGKTYTREKVLAPLLAGLAISCSGSTEAGIRQRLRADTLPVLIDESEGEDPRRREGHLRLARLS